MLCVSPDFAHYGLAGERVKGDARQEPVTPVRGALWRWPREWTDGRAALEADIVRALCVDEACIGIQDLGSGT